MQKIKFITAGAGSGKTYTLTHELADILSSGKVSPSEVIVTTYTKAAAAEIKDRARQVLLDKEGMVLKAAQLDSAAIGTVHGVAQMLVNTYWYELGASPNAELITDEDKRIYRNHSLGQLLEDSRLSAHMEVIRRYYKRFEPKRYVNGKLKPDPEFWAIDVERMVDKMTYYQISDINDSLVRSCAQVDLLTELSADDRDLMKSTIRAIFTLADAWLQRYADYKHQMGLIDYDDMERGLRDLLKQPDVRQEIAQRYKLVMVDEFQDSNPIQLDIFSQLSDIVGPSSPLPQSSIWVGDPKQAIYGFRGADTELVNRVASKFPPVGQPANADGLVSDSLDTSFRTREPLVSLTNELFSPGFPGMTKLKSNRGFVSGMKSEATELWAVSGSSASTRLEAMARHLKALVEQGAYQIVPKDTDILRPLQYGDIAFLARKRTHVKDIVTALQREEIPVWAPETEIIDRAEVQLVLALLHVANSSCQEHEWASLLKLWTDASTEHVFEQRLQYLTTLPADAKDLWHETLSQLAPLRVAVNHAKGLPLHEAISSLILELSLYERVAKWGEPEVRRQNLKTLQSVASNFVTRCARLDITPNIEEFVAYLDETEISSSKEMPKGMVKVVTYHGSKGLEWPMVILYSLDHDAEKDLISHEVVGVHEQVIQSDKDQEKPHYWLHYLPSYSQKEISQQIKDSGAEDWPMVEDARTRIKDEARRLLYVGVTRARDFLVLTVDKKKDGLGSMKWLSDIDIKPESFNAAEVILQPLIPKEPKKPTPPKSANPRKGTLEKYEADKAQYLVDLANYQAAVDREAALANERSQPKLVTLPDLPELQEHKVASRYLHPSLLTKAVAPDAVPVKVAEIAQGIEVNASVDDTNENPLSKSELGTCIHHIFASCPSDGSQPSAADRQAFIQLAAQTLANCRLTEALPHPEQLADSLIALHAWLTQTYGPATRGIEKEYPFCYTWDDDQIMKGEIDMIWRTDKGDVIIDFKNHQNDDTQIADGAPCPHAKHYVPQLQAYRRILELDGRTVLDTLLYYDLKGYLVRV